MHSRFSAVVLSAAIFATFFFTSCIEIDKTLGVDNIPDEYALKLSTVELPLPLQTRMMDSVQALSTETALLGAIRTPEFGLTTSSFATNYAYFSLQKANLGRDRKIKNIYLTIRKSGSNVMDESQQGLPQTIHVYRTTKVIDSTFRYNVELKDTDYIHTPIDSGGVIYTGGDTLRIWLKKSFGQLLLSATDLELDSASHFMNRFKGLLFTCEPPAEGTYGGRLNAFSNAESFIYLNFSFQPTWQAGLARKDTTILIPFASNTSILNISTYESKSHESSADKEYINVEGLGGLKAYTDPIKLKNIINNWLASEGLDPKKVLICKATYTLPFVTDNSTVDFINKYFPASLYPHSRNKDAVGFSYNPLNDIYSDNNYAGNINRSLSCFTGDISSTIQSLVNNSTEDIQANWKKYAMWFSAVSSQTNNSYYSSNTFTTFSLQRDSYSIAKLNGPLHSNYPKLSIVYTVMND